MKDPTLILVSGPPGAGKSTLCRELSRKTGAFLIDKDAIDEPFSPNDRGSGYTAHIEPKVLAAMLSLAELNLKNGHWVILDAPWSHILLNSPSWIPKIEALWPDRIVLECVIPEEVLRRRIQERGFTRDQVKLSAQGWEVFKKSDRLGERIPLKHHEIDMTREPKLCLVDALRAMGYKNQ